MTEVPNSRHQDLIRHSSFVIRISSFSIPMSTPPIFFPATRRVRRERRTQASAPTPPAALTLVAASYNHDVEPVVILSFDRAIDIGGFDGSQIIVEDGFDLGLKFRGTGGASLDDPQTVRVALVEDGDAGVPGTVLTAIAGAGIVAARGGAPWAGVADLGLP